MPRPTSFCDKVSQFMSNTYWVASSVSSYCTKVVGNAFAYTCLSADVLKAKNKREASAFFLSELYDRSEEDGIATFYVLNRPLSYLASYLPNSVQEYIPKVAVISGPSHNVAEVSYIGERFRGRAPDSKARKPFSLFSKAIGESSIIDFVDEEARIRKDRMRRALNGHGSSHDVYQYTHKIFERLFSNFDIEKSLNDEIRYAVVNIIAKKAFGIPAPLSMAYIKALQEISTCFAYEEPSSARFQRAKKTFLTLSQDIIKEQGLLMAKAKEHERGAIIYEAEAREDYQVPTSTEQAEKWYTAVGMVVESNLSALVLIAITQIANDPNIQKKLYEELRSVSNLEDWEKIKSLPYLDRIYQEALRFVSPSAVIPRFISKPTTLTLVNQKQEHHRQTLLPGTTVLFALRRQAHNKQFWQAPHEFNPDRDELMPKLGKKRATLQHSVPFSTGARTCPAISQFAPRVFKAALVGVFAKHALSLKAGTELETIRPSAVEPRYESDYFINKPVCWTDIAEAEEVFAPSC